MAHRSSESDIGQALGSPVSLDCRGKAPFKFNGTFLQVHAKYMLAKAMKARK